jgi:hypothetical protein
LKTTKGGSLVPSAATASTTVALFVFEAESRIETVRAQQLYYFSFQNKQRFGPY